MEIDGKEIKLNSSQIDGVLRRLEESIKAEVEIEEKIKLWDYVELEKVYKEWILNQSKNDVNLAKWLPKMAEYSNGFSPGEVIIILAASSIGKTALLQNLIWQQKLPTIFFSCEMPEILTFQRALQIAKNQTEKEIRADYLGGEEKPEYLFDGAKDCKLVFDRIDVEDICPLVRSYELKNNIKIRIIGIDYLGLLKGRKGKNRYEQTSEIVNTIKEVAKKTQTVVVLLCQIHRPEKVDILDFRPTLGSGKDTGDIENAGDYVFSLWIPDQSDPKQNPFNNLNLEILKNRRGQSNVIIPLHFEHKTQSIWQCPTIEMFESKQG